MSNIIKDYYEKAHIMPALVEQKIERFKKHPDIMAEFEYWIINHKYKTSNAVIVCDYTAQKLSELSPYLRGEGSFVLMLELCDNPEKAKKKIAKGFKMK